MFVTVGLNVFIVNSAYYIGCARSMFVCFGTLHLFSAANDAVRMNHTDKTLLLKEALQQ